MNWSDQKNNAAFYLLTERVFPAKRYSFCKRAIFSNGILRSAFAFCNGCLIKGSRSVLTKLIHGVVFTTASMVEAIASGVFGNGSGSVMQVVLFLRISQWRISP